MTTHFIACTWIIISKFDADKANGWVENYSNGVEIDNADLYLTSYYFTITTITTVGYGDFSAGTSLEKIVCIIIEFLGVIAFSLASGALTNYISQQDTKSAAFEEKMSVLDRLFKTHQFP
jgi:hypothetical protein